MALKQVTDPELLKQLGEPKGSLMPVSDPELLKQLNGESEDPGMLKSAAAGVMSGIPLAETAASGLMSLGDKTYEQSHNELEDLKNRAWEKHPVAYGTGKVAGIAGTAALAPEALGELGLTNTIGQAAVQGAGYGADMAKNLSEAPKDIAMGAAGGAGAGVIGEKVLSPILNSIPGLGKTAVSSLGKDLTTEDINAYLKNPAAIKNALTKPQIGEQLANSVGDIGKASQQLSNQARGLLSSESAPLTSDSLKGVIDDLSQKYLTNGVAVTSADKIALKTLTDLQEQLAQAANASGGQIPETTLRQVIDRLQSAVKENTYGNPDASASQEAMKSLSGKLNGMLRESNPAYAEQMAPSAEAAQLSSDVTKKFNLDNGPTDATAGKLNTVLNEGKTESRDLLDQLHGLTGQDYVNKLQSATTAEHFNAPGSPLGSIASKLTGIPFLKHATGPSAGALDGGQIAKKILDMYVSGEKSNMGQALQKFGPLLIKAAKQGGNNLAATHFVLATSNPEYQKLVDEQSQNQGGQ